MKMTPAAFDRFARFITQQLGIKMSPDKMSMLQSRLQRRLRVLGMNSIEEYQEHLFHSPRSVEELVDFIDLVTTNKTDFFREAGHFDFLTQEALPKLAAMQGRRPGTPWNFKLWCAGCSTGEEPYTLTMVLSEFATTWPGFDFSILATDISTRVLNHASAGIYDEERITPVAMPLRKKYLLRSKDAQRAQVRMVPELRRKIRFQRLNFMDDTYPVRDQFEVIFFRNVMIYFSKETQTAVINKQCRNLVPGGYLFVGHSESLAGLAIPVSSVGMAVYQKYQ
jgi:chemotaxis protein methyltransferase CheR